MCGLAFMVGFWVGRGAWRPEREGDQRSFCLAQGSEFLGW